ncbi:MAG: acyltransferase family protein [Acidobacteriota bacterium]
MSDSATRMPSLDGLRAISISLVLLGHLGGTRGFTPLDLGIGDYAHLGVVVFFVISGFLITNLLLSEHRKKGTISLARFYERRALRLFPASFFFIASIAVFWLLGVLHLQPRDFFHAATYTVNYFPARSWEVGHLWSLSVEEQFYLLWPCAFLMLGPRRAMWLAAAVIVLGPGARSANRLFLIGTPYHDQPMFPMVADSLAMGCLLARASGWLTRQRWYLNMFRPHFAMALLVLILVINRYMDFTVVSVFGTSMINLGVAILIHRSVHCHGDWAGKVLNLRPIAFVGVLSYSLYLWQQLFLNRNAGRWVNGFPQNLILAVIAALASYLLLEKPVMRLRGRLR